MAANLQRGEDALLEPAEQVALRAGPLVRGRWPWGQSRQYSHFLLLLPSCLPQPLGKLEGREPIDVLPDSRACIT